MNKFIGDLNINIKFQKVSKGIRNHKKRTVRKVCIAFTRYAKSDGNYADRNEIPVGKLYNGTFSYDWNQQ